MCNAKVSVFLGLEEGIIDGAKNNLPLKPTMYNEDVSLEILAWSERGI